jgi:hypothetical protein
MDCELGWEIAKSSWSGGRVEVETTARLLEGTGGLAAQAKGAPRATHGDEVRAAGVKVVTFTASQGVTPGRWKLRKTEDNQ